MIGNTKKRRDEDEEELLLIGDSASIQHNTASMSATTDNSSFLSMHACWRGFVWLVNGIIAIGVWLLKPIAFAAVLREVFFSMLMYFALKQSFRQSINVVAPNLDLSNSSIITAVSGILALLNLANDWISVAPADAVNRFLHEPREKNNYRYGLKWVVLLLALTLSYPIGSCSDALGLAPFINEIQDPDTLQAVRAAVLSTVIFLGEIYYAMMTNQNIQNHVNRFIDACKRWNKTWCWMCNNKLGLLEASIISLGNIVYRAILFASLFSLTLTEYYSVDKKIPLVNIFKFIIMLATGITTIFSRTLGVINHYAPYKKNDNISNLSLIHKNFDNKSLWDIVKSVVPHGGFPLIRGIGVALISNWIGNITELPSVFTTTMSLILGTLTFLLGFYAQFKTYLFHHAKSVLEVQSQAIEVYLDGHLLTWEDANLTFQHRIKQYPLSKPVALAIDIINYAVRFARVVGFPVFFMALFMSFNILLSVSAVLGITLFAAGEVAHSELNFYGPLMENTVKGLAVKSEIVNELERIPAMPSDVSETESGIVTKAYHQLRQWGTALWRSGPELLQRKDTLQRYYTPI